MNKRIGVFVCHCGINIAGTVKIPEVLKTIRELPNVAIVKDHQYCCSDPGQNLIKETVEKEKLDGVIVACCSPTLHEPTFRKAVKSVGLNPYVCEIANIREQCSWVTIDKDAATAKAVRIIRTQVARVLHDQPLEPIAVPITRRAMVIGAGVAGIQAALDIANAGHEVVLVEKDPSIGGRMAQLSETFPTLDCSQCILTPKMVEVKQHPNIRLLAYSELQEIAGYVGNFKVTVNQKTRYVKATKCNGCGECSIVCPVQVPSEFDAGLSRRKAIYRPSPQSVPNVFTIDKRGISPCRVACPAGVNAHGYVALIAAGKYKEALALERQANPFASVCGRVCNHPCEADCNRKEVDRPVAICSLKRFVADYELVQGPELPAPIEKVKFDRIAVVGGGPAGLACAYFLSRQGHPVTVFEALPELGGTLITGIPEFRLPRPAIKSDIDYILAHGLEVKTNQMLGRDFRLDDLFGQGFKVVFLGIGAQKGLELNVAGEDLDGVYPVLQFLRDVNLAKGKFGLPGMAGKRVAVVGGGNAAVDAARTALRVGAKEALIVYRRSRREMPANEWEIVEAEHEGVRIVYQAAPVRILGMDGKVVGIECQKVELGAPDATGRRKPMPMPGTEFVIETDFVIPAVSQAPDTSAVQELDKTKWGTLTVDPDSLMTSRDGVFAGGDMVSGPATIIEAVAAGKLAADRIERYLAGEALKPADKVQPEVARFTAEEYAEFPKQERTQMPRLTAADRKIGTVPDLPRPGAVARFPEVETGFSEAEARAEALRCLNCSACCECGECSKVCDLLAIDHELKDEPAEFDVGALLLATGYDLLNLKDYSAFGVGTTPDIIDGLQFERILSASGPTSGEVRRPSDGKVPKRVVFVQCAGSRDRENGKPYCSKVCCMYTAKHALLYKHRVHDGEAIVFYIDVRTGGKGFEEFYQRATDEGVLYLRGKVSKIYRQGDKVVVWGADTLSGQKVTVEADLVVLANAMVPTSESAGLAGVLKAQRDEHGFFNEAHPKLRPVETLTAGYYLAGAGQGPKDIPEAVAQASGAASKVIGLFSQEKLYHEPPIAAVDEDLCSGCGVCVEVCPYHARELVEKDVKGEPKTVIKVNEVLCECCGACSSACPVGACPQRNLGDEQIAEMVKAGLEA